MSETACDFNQSFFHFEIDHTMRPAITVTAKQPVAHNQVRIPLECRCEVTDGNGQKNHYVLAASCKTERVGVERDIWMAPNADFCVVCSDEDFVIIKRWQECGITLERESPEMAQPVERQGGKCDDAWTGHSRDVQMVAARQLESNQQIIETTLRNRPIVSRTEFDLSSGQHVMIEYPIKTINVSNRAGNYQVDTGPVLYPDLSIGHERFVGNFRLAFIAHNCPQWAELIVNVPTPISGGALVNHFSKSVRLDTRNTMLELTGSG